MLRLLPDEQGGGLAPPPQSCSGFRCRFWFQRLKTPERLDGRVEWFDRRLERREVNGRVGVREIVNLRLEGRGDRSEIRSDLLDFGGEDIYFFLICHLFLLQLGYGSPCGSETAGTSVERVHDGPFG